MADPKDYIDDVRRYDAKASIDRVKKIVNYLGIALRSRDASLVSCSDESEKNRVRNGYCFKKLGMDRTEASAAVDAVCVEMKADRNKQRVTFYYLLAKNAGKLESL